MFTQPIASPPPGPMTSSSRPSRLRGLSYLRNYTHNHLLSRDGHHSGSPSASGSGSTSPAHQVSGASLTRSLSHSPTTTTTGPPPPPSALNNHHLTLVSSTPDPVSYSSGTSPARSSAPPTTSSTTTPTQTPAAAVSSTSQPATDPSVTPTPAQEQPAASGTPTAVASGAESSAPPSADIVATAARTTTTTNNNTNSSSNHSLAAADPLQEQSEMTRSRAATAGDAAAAGNATPADNMPSIRLSAYYDPRSARPSLTFSPISRTLPTGTERIRVGRYSERDSQSMANTPGNQPSAAAVGFKSKVVSRRHCEFWCEDGKWYIKDVKSSSGTFLNHIRLSPPSQESKAFPVNDGDIVQLGIDFKGGEEMIFRCVKMRLELNRGWQNKLNTFNMAAHKRLQNMAATGATPGTGSSQDCSICLSSIAPCQSLFVAPCSHTWHFKCVRSLLTSPQYPIFICPNCRAGADLEADVDELAEEWEQLKEEEEAGSDPQLEAPSDVSPIVSPIEPEPAAVGVPAPPLDPPTPDAEPEVSDQEMDPMDTTINVTPEAPQRNPPHVVSSPLPIRNPSSGAGRPNPLRDSRTPSPPGLTNGTEGPITPRNNAGPWVFDGSAGREGGPATAEMTSLDAAAEMNTTDQSRGNGAVQR